MIVKMTKYSFLVYHKQYLEFLERIKEIGVLHIIEKPESILENDILRDKMQTASHIKSALKKLESYRPKGAELAPFDKNRDGLAVLKEVENALNEKERLEQLLAQSEKERDSMEVWGNFSSEQIEKVREAGFVLNFFATSVQKFDPEWEIQYNAFEIDQVGSTIYFVTVTRPDETVDVDADRITLADKTTPELDAEITKIYAQIRTLDDEIKHRAVSDYNTLKEAEVQTLTDVAFNKALLSTQSEADDKVKLLEGWCPDGSENALNTYLQESHIYYQTSEPKEDENVPIKLKNNRFARMFEFIGELYELPNYFARDLTAFFAPFYVIFFGLCLGDMGYGLLLMLAGLYLRKKVQDVAIKSVMSLLAVLGGGAVVMGMISGTFFGIELLEVNATWFQSFKVMMFNPEQLFNNALILGGVQILFAMILRLIHKIQSHGFLASVSHLGWLILLVGGGGMLALHSLGSSESTSETTTVTGLFGYVNLATVRWLAIIFSILGGTCIFVLSDVKRNVFVNIGSGLWDTYNMVTGLFGDFLSYIRLFAVGFSGSVMGLVFNNLAFEVGETVGVPVASQLVILLILLFGHSVNIAISLIGSFVHPLRLTFVEFYKNAGFEGGGKKYKPFERYKEETKII